MHSSLLLALYASSALAGPLFGRRTAARSEIEACEQAINCELVHNGNSTSIRFKPGMEPGSEKYKQLTARSKRAEDGDIETQVTLSDDKVVYGCTEDARTDPFAMLGNLDKVCKDTGSCLESEEYTEEVDWITPNTEGVTYGQPLPTTWHLRGEGVYSAEHQSEFIQAVQAVADSAPLVYDQSWNDVYIQGACRMVQQTGEYYISRFVWIEGEKVLQGYIKAFVSVDGFEGKVGGMCDYLEVPIAAGFVAGAIPAIGPPMAVFFGLVQAVCAGMQ